MPPTNDPPWRAQSLHRPFEPYSETDVPPGYDIPSRDELEEADIDELSAYVDELTDAVDACKSRLERYKESHERAASELSERREFEDSTHQQFRNVATETRQSVLAVSEPWGRFSPKRVFGTAWVLDDGVVVTASPIVEGPTAANYPEWDGEIPEWHDERQLWTIDGSERAVDAERVLDDAVTVIETETDGIEPLSLASGEAVDDGDPLLAIGHPMFVGEWVPTVGTHAGTASDGRFRLDAPVSHGTTNAAFLPSQMLGSPVFDESGTVVGIVVGVEEREANPTVGTYSRSERVFQQFPDTFDLVVVTAERVREAVETVSSPDMSDAIGPGRPDDTGLDRGGADD